MAFAVMLLFRGPRLGARAPSNARARQNIFEQEQQRGARPVPPKKLAVP
jgi:hypothetical protein